MVVFIGTGCGGSFKKGADKVSVNSSVLKDPGLIDRLAAAFGKQWLSWRWMLVEMVKSGECTVMGDGWLPIGNFFHG